MAAAGMRRGRPLGPRGPEADLRGHGSPTLRAGSGADGRLGDSSVPVGGDLTSS